MRNRSEDQVMLVMIRHGETAANREHRYLGKTDESLSGDGIMTLVSYRERKYYPDVEYLFSGPMKRCLETAGILYPNLHPTVIPEWTEMDFGEFEYRNYEELEGDARYQAWIDSGGTLAFPGGESREDFVMRCERGFARMCDELCRKTRQYTDRDIRAGIIVHGGTIMALMSSHGGSQSSVFGRSRGDAFRKKDYFDYQAANGKGYVCSMEGWRKYVQTGRGQCNPIRIEEVKKL